MKLNDVQLHFGFVILAKLMVKEIMQFQKYWIQIYPAIDVPLREIERDRDR
jgi:hypothetical protein